MDVSRTEHMGSGGVYVGRVKKRKIKEALITN